MCVTPQGSNGYGVGGDGIAFQSQVIELLILMQQRKQGGQELRKLLDVVFFPKEHKLRIRGAARDALKAVPVRSYAAMSEDLQ